MTKVLVQWRNLGYCHCNFRLFDLKKEYDVFQPFNCQHVSTNWI